MNRKRITLLLMLALLLAGLVVASPVLAGERVSRGEALSLLYGWTNARQAIQLNDGVAAAQFTDPFGVAINPVRSGGSHYCEEDHQVAMLAWISSVTDFQDASASLATVAHDIVIDGQQYETIRTPVVQRVGTEPGEKRFGYSEGAILAPGDLSVGMHTLEVPIYFDGVFLFAPSINFYIDAAGTGACL